MNVLLLGNGFDLNHMFPTSYINFLNTVNFLINSDVHTFSTIGEVFGSEELQHKDCFIKKCYETHFDVYDSISLEKETVEKMINTAKTNLWFNYLSKSIPKDITWIDFEKEIVRVIEAFTNFLESDIFTLTNDQVVFNFAEYTNGEDKYILKSFPFFFEKKEQNVHTHYEMAKFRDEYVREERTGSGTYHLLEDGIIEELYLSLRELADILKMYLLLFIDVVSQEYKTCGFKAKFSSLPVAERVYSFNYTNTYEILYRPNIVEHIHGNTNTDIVLGVNPDEKDEVYNIDTAFLYFKKYFQRTFYSTDNSFLKKIYMESKAGSLGITNLYVIGHSLDVTDKDTIKLIFESADRIFVLYHNDQSAKNQIKNLVEIYGKEGFDILRARKELCFIKQSAVGWVPPTAEEQM